MEMLRGPREELDARAAEIVGAVIAALARRQPQVVLGVVGGRSVGGIYHHLTAADLPWSKVRLFLADERLVPIDSDESNYKLVRADLLDALLAAGRMAEANAHPFAWDPGAPDQGVARYGEALERVGGRFDVALLSAGEDGHCASLFPGHPSVADDGERFVLVEGSPKPPPRRVSASRRLLERTGLGIMLFYGEEKRAALEKFHDAAVDLRDCPSKVVERMARGYVLTDLA